MEHKMKSSVRIDTEHCIGCVYYPPNLPLEAYPAEDYALLIGKTCSFDFKPGDSNCTDSRKTSCSLINLDQDH